MGVRFRFALVLLAFLIAPSLRAGWFDTGDLLVAHGRAEAAYRVYGELFDIDEVPRDGLLFRRAECEMELSRAADAMPKYRQLIRAFPNSRYAKEARFRLVAEDLKAKDRLVRRIAVAEMLEFCFAKAGSPYAEEAAVAAATTCYNDGDYVDARRLAERMLRRYPRGEYVEAFTRLARWSAYRGGETNALARLCQDADDEEAVYLRAAMALDAGHSDEASVGFEEYLERFPQGEYRALAEEYLAHAIFRGAAAAEKAGQSDAAIRLYDKMIAKKPGGGLSAEEALFRKATVEFNKGNWTNVTETLNTLLKSDAVTTRRGPALYLCGVAEWKVGEDEMASNLVARALKTGLTPAYEREAKIFLEFLTTNVTKKARGDVQK